MFLGYKHLYDYQSIEINFVFDAWLDSVKIPQFHILKIDEKSRNRAEGVGVHGLMEASHRAIPKMTFALPLIVLIYANASTH